MLQEKYKELLELGQELGVEDGFVKEEGGKLVIGGNAKYQLEKDQLWDKIKSYENWENEVQAEIGVKNEDVYGVYTVQPGDSLSKLSKKLFGTYHRYMEIFELNRDILDDPNLIKVGQKLKLPPK